MHNRSKNPTPGTLSSYTLKKHVPNGVFHGGIHGYPKMLGLWTMENPSVFMDDN
jgi:hypothetical protein